MEKTLNLIKNDPWLEPYAEAITGRHEYAMYKEAELTMVENRLYRTLLRDICISVCIVQIKDGLSANGHPMQPIFIWLVHLIIGKKKRSIA